MFCDKVEISIKAGNGGDGSLSFLHEKYREFGGPDGGDGGNGGDVIFRVNPSWNTLYYYKTNRHLKAENGEQGKGRRKHGRDGENLIVDVPIGTSIHASETGKLIADLDYEGAEAVIAHGGEGGYGNAHFAASTRQTPRFAEVGIKGEELSLRLELKLVADVALMGLPNIGKSTFLSVVSSAKPKIADYQFTTVVPNLGVVEGFDTPGFIIADLPGLIEGAAQGKGLGDEFLRHIERTRVVVHLLDAMSENILSDFDKITAEVKEFNVNILKKPQILVISRSDLVDDDRLNNQIRIAEKIIKNNPDIFKLDKKPFVIASVSHRGVKELVREIASELEKIPKQFSEIKNKKRVHTIEEIPEKIESRIIVKENSFRVEAPRLERFVLKTDFNNPYAVARIYDIMTRMGIIKKLEKKGARYGDKIYVLDKSVEYKG